MISRAPEVGGINLRPARVEDVANIVALEREVAEAPHWPISAYEAMILRDNRLLLVAETGGQLLGFAAGSIAAGAGELESVAVASSARRVGAGRRLCAEVVAWCRRCGAAEVLLEVRASSAAATALYAGLGFVPSGRRPRYYRDPEEDATQMRLVFADDLPTSSDVDCGAL